MLCTHRQVWWHPPHKVCIKSLKSGVYFIFTPLCKNASPPPFLPSSPLFSFAVLSSSPLFFSFTPSLLLFLFSYFPSSLQSRRSCPRVVHDSLALCYWTVPPVSSVATLLCFVCWLQSVLYTEESRYSSPAAGYNVETMMSQLRATAAITFGSFSSS